MTQQAGAMYKVNPSLQSASPIKATLNVGHCRFQPPPYLSIYFSNILTMLNFGILSFMLMFDSFVQCWPLWGERTVSYPYSTVVMVTTFVYADNVTLIVT